MRRLNYNKKIFNKKNIFLIIYILINIYVFALESKNDMLNFAMILSVIFPLATSIYIFFYQHEKMDFKEGFDKILNLWMDIMIFFVVLSFVVIFIDMIEVDNNFIKPLIFFNVYISFVVFEILFVNYFASSSSIIRKRIIIIVEEISYFFKQHLLLTIMAILLCIFLPSKDISLAIVGSYVFFLLEEVSKKYYNKSKNLSSIKYGHQIIVNICLFFELYIIETIFNNIVYLRFIDDFDMFLISIFAIALLTVIQFYIAMNQNHKLFNEDNLNKNDIDNVANS